MDAVLKTDPTVREDRLGRIVNKMSDLLTWRLSTDWSWEQLGPEAFEQSLQIVIDWYSPQKARYYDVIIDEQVDPDRSHRVLKEVVRRLHAQQRDILNRAYGELADGASKVEVRVRRDDIQIVGLA